MQVPCEHIVGTLARKSAGHVSEQALPHCPAPREHIAVHMAMSLDTQNGNYALNEQYEGCHAQNAASVEGLGNIRASGRCRSRGELNPPLALSLRGY